MLWIPGNDMPWGEPVFVRSGDLSSLRARPRHPGGAYPLVVEVLPNGELRVALIDVLVAMDARPDTPGPAAELAAMLRPSPVSGAPPYTPFLRAARGVVEAARALDPHALVKFCDDAAHWALALDPAARPPRILDVLNLLRFFAENLLHPLIHGGVLVHPDNSGKRERWWLEKASLLDNCRACRKEIVRVFTMDYPLELRALDHWLRELEAQIGKLHKAYGSNEADVLRQASALCIALSDRHFIEAQASMALLYLHRAADLLMQAKCVDHNLIAFGLRGATYKIGPATDKVGLLFSLDRLAITLSSMHGIEKPLIQLNAWRNLFVQAHYMTACEPGVARSLYKEIRAKLRPFATPDWETASKVFAEPIPVPAHALLDVDGSVRRTFRIA